MKKISIITVTYNCKDDIEETILSVIGQTYDNIEYVIIDGGSTDGTLDLIKDYREHIDLLISEPDNGIFDAMNKGIQFSTGEWVNFMNAGDHFFQKNTVEKIFSKEWTSVGVIYGKTFSKGDVIQPANLSSLRFGGIMACHQSIFYNRQICGAEFYYPTKFKHYGDIELTRRLYLKQIYFTEVDIVIARYKGGGFSSIVSTNARKAKFGYLFLNMGLLGLFYGVLGKVIYLKSKLFGQSCSQS